MPPEPLPWDRKELRKHEGGGGGGSAVGGGLGFGGPRWREPPFPHHHPYYNHHQQHHHGGGGPPRWVPDFRYRLPPGHAKQGGRHLYLDDFGHGFVSSRSNDKMVDDESCRPSGSGRYGRSSRENRGSFGQKDWKGHSSEISPILNGPGRPNSTSDQKSADHMLLHNSSLPSSDSTNSRDQTQSKDQLDVNGAIDAAGSTGQKLERENSLNSIGWKPLKWTRSGSLSSRGSSLSHSSSSKTMAPESDDTKVELMLKNVTCTQSPFGDDAAAAVSSVVSSEETNSRKKPRLGWGEGLAKYEKKKVEGADDSATKNGITVCGNSELGSSLASNLTEKSPKVVGFSECASPATPSSVACSSSPGVEEKLLVKEGTVDHDSANTCSSPSVLSHTHSAGSAFNLENLDLTSLSHLNLSINELLQLDDSSSLDSGYVRSSAMNKLLVWKNDISKVLEATESEIDLLENELKSLIPEPERSYPCLAAYCSVPAECDSKSCEDHIAASSVSLKHAALQLVPSGCMIVEDAVNAPNDEHVSLKDEDVDSPGSATSKFVQMSSSTNDVCPPYVLKNVETFMEPGANKFGKGLGCCVDDRNKEKAVELPAPEVKSQLIASTSPVTSSDDVLQSGREEISYELILASNRDCANRASEVINKLLPTSECHFGISNVSSASCLENDSIKGRFLGRKRSLWLKERLITIKFKMLRHMWKEDTRLLSLKKLRTKPQKKSDCSLRVVNGGYQKHRSSIRSRCSAAISLSLEATMEMIDYASRLLSGPQVKLQSSALKMPALILDKQERMALRFISSNGLVEDPCAVEKERPLMNPWTLEEKKIFLDKLVEFGKDFRKISSFLGHKTTADCIEFYYKNHKSDSFEKTKNKPDSAKRAKSYSSNTYLVASGKRWNREANAVSLDILGAASAVAANGHHDSFVKIQQNCASKSFLAVSSSSRIPRGDDGLLERSNSLDNNDERETAAADVLAGICGSLSSEAMSSCVTSSVDPGESYQEWKYQRVGSSTRWHLTPEVTQNVDDETCSDESCGEMDPTDWNDEEKSLFIRAVSSYGRDFAMISRCVRTRSRDQCKVFFSKARKCLGLDMICPGPGNLIIDDANGGGSDMEDACVMESGSVICSEKSGFKMEVDIPSPEMKLKHDHDLVGMTYVKPDLNKMEEDNEVGDIDSTHTLLMSKSSIPDGCQVESKSELDFNGIGGAGNDMSPKLTSVQALENVLRNSDMEVAEGVGGSYDHNLANALGTETQSGDANGAYVEDPRAKLEGQGSILHKNDTNVNKVVKGESGINAVRCSLQGNQSEARITGNESHFIADTSTSRFHQRTDLEMDSVQKPHVTGMQESTSSVPLDAGKSTDNSSSVLDGEKITNEHRAKDARTNEQHLDGHSAAEQLESSSTLGVCSVPMSTMKGMIVDISCKKSVTIQGSRQSDGINFSQFSAQDSYFQRCNSSKPVSSGGELSFSFQKQSRECSRSTSCSPSDVDKPCSNGNVKLFGQILTKPAELKPNSSAECNDDSSTLHQNVGNKSSKTKSSSSETVNGHSALRKYDCDHFGSLENLALRNINVWDRNRIQNGFSSIPESAILLAKYPSAFNNYAVPSSKMDQRPLQGAGKNGECSLNSVSVLPTRDMCDSNGLADFQVYGNQDRQPFTVDMRQKHDILFSEMQRRNGFEVVSGMQQHSRGMVGINVVGRGGVLVGGQCTGVSDPVAAIRMQYAKAEHFGGQTGNMINRDDDSWRGKGNIGR